ncbi:MAG TPA: sigma-70 family RNA polymerase sigma factor [Candidatus Elarobacter sp.]|nr:sigma-70 family RNA polymerase sigma factor [Candidatus Elarobacter sp.]
MKKPGFDDFERLVRENQRVVYQIAFGLLGNASDAEDVTQDAFVLAFTKATSLRKPERFRSWVCRIARNLALNRIRADNRSRRREDLAAGDATAVVDIAAVAEDREFEARVRVEIDRLPQKLRDALLLCAIQELEPSTVAGLLGIPQGTVRSRLHLARKRLLRALSS